LSHRKQVKLQWLHDPCKINGNVSNSVGREDNRHFRNKKKEYLIYKTNELATNSKDRIIRDLYRGINDSIRSH
jgi:hypothetical protein